MPFHRKTLQKGARYQITEVIPSENVEQGWIAQPNDGDPGAITDHICKFVHKFAKLSHEPAIGESIIAQFDEDGYYYRAQVQRKTRNGFDLIFVDFGNEVELLSWRDAYRMPASGGFGGGLDLARIETNCIFWQDQSLRGVTSEAILNVIGDYADDVYFVPLEQASGPFTDQPVRGELLIVDGFGVEKRVSDILSQITSVHGVSGFPDSTCLNSPSDSLDLSTEPQRRFEMGDYSASQRVECYLGLPIDRANELIWLEVAHNDERRCQFHDDLQPLAEMAKSRNFYEGDLVLAMYDGAWDRGLLLNVKDAENEATVLFVDFGNTENVSLDHVRHHQRIHEEPMFMMPVKIPSAINTHVEQLEQLVRKALEDDTDFQFRVFVDNIEISDDPKWPMQVVKTANIILVDKIEGNAIGLAEYLGVRATSFTKQSNQSLEIPLGTLPLSRFSCDLIEKSEEIDGLFFILPHNAFDDREVLCTELQENKQPSVFEGAQVGDACLALYQNELYRAVVIDCDEHAEYTINFVDYGNSLKTSSIFQISREHAAVPRFAIPIAFERPLDVIEQEELCKSICDETRAIAAAFRSPCNKVGMYEVDLFIDDKPLFEYLAFEQKRFDEPDSPARVNLLQNLESPLDDIELDKLAAPTKNSTQLNEVIKADSIKTGPSVTSERTAPSSKHSARSSQITNGLKREIAPSMNSSTSEMSSSIIDINTTQADDYTHIIVTKVKCSSRVTISFMELSKWHELQELIDGAMEHIQPVNDYPAKWSECIVRDKGYDKADTGFRRARVIDLSKLPRVSVELIDSSKKVSFKCSRIYPSPSIIGSLEKTSMTAAISSSAAANLQLVEGGKYRAVLDHSGRDIVIRQIHEIITVDTVSETFRQLQAHCTKLFAKQSMQQMIVIWLGNSCYG